MARRNDTTDTVSVDQDVDVTAPEDDETETIPSDQERAGQGPADPSKASTPKAPKNPRWAPPEGYLTPVGFAKVVTERKLHTPRGATAPAEVSSQMVYSYAKNSPASDKFPMTYFDASGNAVTEVNGTEITGANFKELGVHQAVKVEEGVAWWERKNERVAARAQNAAAKAEKKVAKGEKPAQAASEAVVEAEDDEVRELSDGDTASAVEAE
jgi:hypothetical protein